MNLKHVGIVLKKEIKDILRDRKTVITSILLPMVLIPVFNILVGSGAQNLQKNMNENITIALSETSNTPEIRQLVQERIVGDNPNIRLIEVKDPVEAVRKENVRVVLEFEKDYAEKLKAGKTFVIKLLYDNSKSKSEGGMRNVSQAIFRFNRLVVEERVIAAGLSKEMLEPSIVEETNVADKNLGGNPILMMTLPMMIGLLVTLGGIPAATDLVAGEKERNTFEPLLTTRPGRGSILIGKYLAVTLFSFASVLAILAGMVIGYSINPNSLTMGVQGDIGFNIPPLAILLALIITVALGMTFTGLQIALSTYARSFKEAQTYMSLLIFAAMIPAYATMFSEPGDIGMVMYGLPVINTISAFKMVLGGMIDYTKLVLALGTSVVYVGVTLWLAAWLFNKEKVLFRS